MDLFEYAKSKTLDRESPLASRLRPTTVKTNYYTAPSRPIS